MKGNLPPSARGYGLLAAVAVVVFAGQVRAQNVGGVELIELTISDAHEAMLAGTLTSRALVEAYLERIRTFDKRGPTFNAIIMVNPNALARADELDAALRRTGELTGPLHGVPFIVKDNYDTQDMPTTGGSASLAGSIPADDAYQVRRIRAAGAIVLAKSNLSEFAFTAMETVGSRLPGWTFNPYQLNRVTAGSSGGTAAGLAANDALGGLGTDTGNSIRGPSSHNALVGIRSTQGLTSRDGIIPLFAHRDIGGPMTRTVEDAVRIFDVIAGIDPADPVTAEADARRPATYMDFLQTDLDGVRIGLPSVRGDAGHERAVHRGAGRGGAPEGRRAGRDGRPRCRRSRVPHVEQPAAARRRPHVPARQQQPDPVTADRLPGDHGADGLRVGRRAAGGSPDLWGCVVGADPDPDRLCVRASDEA